MFNLQEELVIYNLVIPKAGVSLSWDSAILTALKAPLFESAEVLVGRRFPAWDWGLRVPRQSSGMQKARPVPARSLRGASACFPARTGSAQSNRGGIWEAWWPRGSFLGNPKYQLAKNV